MSVLDLRVPI